MDANLSRLPGDTLVPIQAWTRAEMARTGLAGIVGILKCHERHILEGRQDAEQTIRMIRDEAIKHAPHLFATDLDREIGESLRSQSDYFRSVENRPWVDHDAEESETERLRRLA